MSDRISVAFIVSSLRFGGVEKGSVTRFNKLSFSRFRKGLVYLKNENHLFPLIDARQGEVACMHFCSGWDFAGLRRLASWLVNFRPNVILSVNAYPLFYAFLAKLLTCSKVKLIVSFHSTELPTKEDRKMRLVYRYFFNRSDRIVYVSQIQRAYWEARGLRADLGTLIYNGVDTDHFNDNYSQEDKLTLRRQYGFDSSDFVIGICAALRPEKQHEDLLEALVILKESGLPAKCFVIGDGPRRHAIEAKIKSLGIYMDVAITGFQQDVRPFIAACTCMAIVSHQVETFSNAVLEAMAIGKPMVISEIGGAAEQVKDGETGYLYPAGDVTALTNALIKISDCDRSNEMGRQARALVVAEFGLKVMLKRYAELFEQCADK